MDLRNRVYSKLVQQPIGFFQHNPAGRLMSAVINDVEQVRSAFSEFLADFFRQIFALIAFVIVLLTINWRLALGSAIFIPLIVVPVGRLGRKIRRSSETSRSRLADLSHILQETITGNRVVKAFGMERFEIGRFREAARQLLRENMRWVRAYVATSPMMDVLAAVVFSLLILYARDQIKHNLHDPGHVLRLRLFAIQSLRAGKAPRRHLSTLPASLRRLHSSLPIPRSTQKKSPKPPAPQPFQHSPAK